MEVAPGPRLGPVPKPLPAEFSHSTPDNFLRDLEALVSSLEDSFASTESTLDAASRASPTSAAKLQVEKERRQKLIGKISQVLNSSASGVGGGTFDASVDDSLSMANNSALGEGEVGAEWKRNTLMRLRKFLKKKYRQKKNKLIESASKPGCTSEWMQSEKSQIVQIAADIRSIEFEIRLLSGAKTVQQVGRVGEQAGSGISQHKAYLSLRSSEKAGNSVDDASAGLSEVKRQLADLYSQDDPLEQDRANTSEALLEHDASHDPSSSRAAAPRENTSPSPDMLADSSSEMLSSGQPRHMAKIDRPSLLAVKRNLLSCYDDQGAPQDPNESSSVSSRHQFSALLKRPATSEAYQAGSAGPMRAVHGSPGGLFDKFDQSEGTSDAPGEWTDVDLGRWATVSKQVAVSPVVVRATAASPMPVVLHHRVVRGRVIETDMGVEALDDTLPLDVAMDNSAFSSVHDTITLDEEELGHAAPRRPLGYLLPSLGLTILPSMPEEGGAGTIFDSSALLGSEHDDEQLLALLTRIFSGPLAKTPLTSRYSGLDPELAMGMDSMLACRDEADAAPEELAAACLRELPRGSGVSACEGRNLMMEFECLPLHATVVHTCAQLLADSKHAAAAAAAEWPVGRAIAGLDTSTESVYSEGAEYAYVGDATPVGEPSEACSRALRFSSLALSKQRAHMEEEEEEEEEEEVDDSESAAGLVRRSLEVAKRLDFGGGAGAVVEPILPSDCGAGQGAGDDADDDCSDDSLLDSFDAPSAYPDEPSGSLASIGVRVVHGQAAAASPQLCSTAANSSADDSAEASQPSSWARASPAKLATASRALKRAGAAAAPGARQGSGAAGDARHNPVRGASSPPALAARPVVSTVVSRGDARATPSPKHAVHSRGKAAAPRFGGEAGGLSSSSSSRPVNRPTTPTPNLKRECHPASTVARPTTPTPHRRAPFQVLQDAATSRASLGSSPLHPSPSALGVDDAAPAASLPAAAAVKEPLPADATDYASRSPTAAAPRLLPSKPSTRLLALSEPRRAPQSFAHATSNKALSPPPEPRGRGLGGATLLPQRLSFSAATGGTAVQGLGGNKADLASSSGMAPSCSAGEGPLASFAAASGATGHRVVVQDRLRSLRPLPPPSTSTLQPEAESGLAPVGGKRLCAPPVFGAGVASLQPCSRPPVVVQLGEGQHVEVLDALRQAAAEKLQSYRSRVAAGSFGASNQTCDV